ncbi:MAG TPA: ABATE domain-containing protein [Thermoanaerobaculia bacterium]|jgi:predicted RNA-binding Zn ribbon-like protein
MEQEPIFELSGGALCLDFANTWGDRGRPETDKLRGYSDLLAFALQAGLLTAGDEARLARRAEREPREAAAALALARDLREALYGIFSAAAAGSGPEAADLERLNAALPKALSHLRLERQGMELVWGWATPDDPLESPLWPVLRAAADLLTSEERRQVRECAANACTWLFLDHSRNRSRRWCSMETCGNRAKAQRHYRRRTDEDSGIQ